MQLNYKDPKLIVQNSLIRHENLYLGFLISNSKHMNGDESNKHTSMYMNIIMYRNKKKKND